MSSTTRSQVLDVLHDRGFVHQITDEAALRSLLDTEQVTAYIGFDPTASSLHVGSFVQILALMHLQRAGHRPLVVIGGGTGLVGDPSGKTEMRKLLDDEAVAQNLAKFRRTFERFLDFGPEGALLVDNAEWLCELNYVRFLREVGRHFSVNQMLAAEAYKQRMETGLSFLEFNYQVLQAYDFYHLHEKHGCRLQIGGSDQWGNICAGIELTRRMAGVEVFGLTIPLVTTSSGAKMGKTEKGAVWIDAELCSPYDFFQFWVQVDDRDVERFLKMFTFLPLEEVTALTSQGGAALREAKRRLAIEVTTLVHGADEAQRADTAAKQLFGGADGDMQGVPSTELDASSFPMGVLDLFLAAGLTKSKSDARRLVQGGGAYVGDDRVASIDLEVGTDRFEDGALLLRAGKRKYHRILLSNEA